MLSFFNEMSERVALKVALSAAVGPQAMFVCGLWATVADRWFGTTCSRNEIVDSCLMSSSPAYIHTYGN